MKIIPLLLAATLIAFRTASAQSVSLTVGTAATQNFDTLALTGTSSTLPNGWYLSEAGSGSPNTAYAAGIGSDNAGDTYSFGAASSTDRAFGTLRSGSLASTIGASFTMTSLTTSLVISYTGEMWRLGTAGRGADRLDFQYSTNATSLTTGTWVDFNTLDFNSPVTAGSTGALNGNSSTNQAGVSGVVTGLSVANGATVWIRWTDFDATSADDGLAIDNFSVTAVPEPSTYGIAFAGLLGVVIVIRRRKALM